MSDLVIDFPNVEIFSTGTFNGKVTTLEDLQDAVKAYNELGYMPDIKITHEDTKADRDKRYDIFKKFPFILGKVANLRLVANKLIGDYVNVLEPVKKMIQDKLLITHSAEYYRNIKADNANKSYKALFSAVALLPVGEIPALFEVFKPYMYGLEKSSIENFESLHIDDFEHGKKLIYVISEEINTMTEEEYKKAMMKYSEMGMSIMSFAKFSALSEAAQKEYMDKMKEESDETMSKNTVQVEPKQEPINTANIIDENKRLNAEVEQYKLEFAKSKEAEIEARFKQKEDALNAKLKEQEDEQKALKFRLDQLALDKNEAEDKDFISNLIRSAKLSPGKESFALAKMKEFRKADIETPVKLKFSVGDTIQEFSVTDAVKDFMNNILIENKAYLTDELAPDNEGLTKQQKEKYSVDADPKSVMYQLQAEKYAKENNIDISTTEGLTECLTAVGAYDALMKL